jgi:hypothetical protein
LHDEPDTDTADLEDRAASRPEPQQMQGPATPCRKPPLRRRMRAVLEKLKPFPACD